MPDYSYGRITGRAARANAAAQAAAPAQAPTVAATPEAAAANTNADPGREADGARAMFDLRTSPAAWFVIFTLMAAMLARSTGLVRA